MWGIIRFHLPFAAYEEYLSKIIPAAYEYLTNVLDWDNNDDKDLKAIAEDTGNWETTLPSELGLLESTMDEIRNQHVGKRLRYAYTLLQIIFI